MPNPASSQRKQTAPASEGPERNAAFTEANAWHKVGTGWQRVFGSFKGLGYSIEWHKFYARQEFDWGASFHPGGVELCLNLEGSGYVAGTAARQEFAPATAGFYRRIEAPLIARRYAEQQHEFLTVEFSNEFLARHLAGTQAKLHPLIRAAMENKAQPSGPAAA